MRVFNTYGDSNCNFSFIENLIKKKKSKEKVKLINGGRSVRDFIHVDDVAKIYKIFLKKMSALVFMTLAQETDIQLKI